MKRRLRVVPVIDLKGGVAVHAVAGERDRYYPLASEICHGCDPRDVALALRQVFGFQHVYVADLDAIEAGGINIAAYQSIADSEMRIWLDAGVHTACELADVPDDIIDRRIFGLESLQSMASLSDALALFGPQRVVFSLDLKNGVPLAKDVCLVEASPLAIAREAIGLGVEQMIILDLADVGVYRGSRTGELCRSIKRFAPQIELTAGGGVRNADDLRELAGHGCNGVLVATAIHRQWITAEDVQKLAAGD